MITTYGDTNRRHVLSDGVHDSSVGVSQLMDPLHYGLANRR